MYANSQIIAQHNDTADRYFYVHDRLGSVRQVVGIVDDEPAVVLNYTYSPFGQMLEEGGSFDNSFLFTGQWFDSQFSQYYLRARQYDPVLMRFGARDPVFGKFQNPLTFHPYLYCLNDPVNRIDPDGEFWGLPEDIQALLLVQGVVLCLMLVYQMLRMFRNFLVALLKEEYLVPLHYGAYR